MVRPQDPPGCGLHRAAEVGVIERNLQLPSEVHSEHAHDLAWFRKSIEIAAKNHTFPIDSYGEPSVPFERLRRRGVSRPRRTTTTAFGNCPHGKIADRWCVAKHCAFDNPTFEQRHLLLSLIQTTESNKNRAQKYNDERSRRHYA